MPDGSTSIAFVNGGELMTPLQIQGLDEVLGRSFHHSAFAGDKRRNLPIGLYRVWWKQPAERMISMAAIGKTGNGTSWIALTEYSGPVYSRTRDDGSEYRYTKAATTADEVWEQFERFDLLDYSSSE